MIFFKDNLLKLSLICAGVLVIGVGICFGYLRFVDYQKYQTEKEKLAQELIKAQQQALEEVEDNKKKIDLSAFEANDAPENKVEETTKNPLTNLRKLAEEEKTTSDEDVKDHGDNDGDHLENWIEDELGIDKNKADTDGDGVPDSLDEHPLDNSSIINKIYKVKDDVTGIIFPIRVNVPLDAYIMFKSELKHNFEPDAKNIVSYAMHKDRYIQDIVKQVLVAAVEYDANWYQMFRNLVAEIVYNEDAFTGYDEYPKYPIETLVDGSGDCEDTSILLASLLRGFQYRWQTNLAGTPIEHDFDDVNIGFLVMPGHIAVGYWTPEFEQIFDPSYKYYGLIDVARYTDKDGKKYCYVETTSNDFVVCELPSQAKEISKNVYIYSLSE